MSEWLSRQSAGALIPLVAVAGGMLIALVSIVGGLWWNGRRAHFLARQAEWEAELKRDMVARGMSADEIERVMKCSAIEAAGEAAQHARVPAGCCG